MERMVILLYYLANYVIPNLRRDIGEHAHVSFQSRTQTHASDHDHLSCKLETHAQAFSDKIW